MRVCIPHNRNKRNDFGTCAALVWLKSERFKHKLNCVHHATCFNRFSPTLMEALCYTPQEKSELRVKTEPITASTTLKICLKWHV